MRIQRMMTAGCKLRIALIIIISLTAGFVSSVTLDSMFMVKYALNLFAQESMRDTLWLGFDSESGYVSDEYNPYSIESINSLKTIPGVENMGAQVGMLSLFEGESVLAISESLLTRMQIPLSAGDWDFSVMDQSVYPAVVSYDLSKKYPIGTTMPLQAAGDSHDSAFSITIKVVGALNEFGGLPNFNAGLFVSYPNLNNILLWHKLRNSIVIPLGALPLSEERGYNVKSVIAVHMTDDASGVGDNTIALQEALYEKGYGFTNTGVMLARRAQEIELRDTGRYRLMIYLFIALTAAGVVCYNIAFAYHKRRDLSVLRLLGVTKNRIALNWALMMSYSHILPVIIGLSLGQLVITNGQAYFLNRLQIMPEAVFAGIAIILLATYWLSYCFMSKDISKSMKED